MKGFFDAREHARKSHIGTHKTRAFAVPSSLIRCARIGRPPPELGKVELQQGCGHAPGGIRQPTDALTIDRGRIPANPRTRL